VRFIKWAEQTFTSGGRETEVLPLLERCTRELRETRFEQYRDDARFLRVWVKYADLGKQPHDIFKFLETNDIGQRHTLFYEAYAAFLEMKGAYGKAAETYDRGVVMRAHPRDRLKDKLAQFQHRMMRRERRKAENRANGVEDDTGELAETAARRFGDRRGGAGRSAEAENPGAAPRGVVGGGVAGTVGAPPVGAGGSKRGRSMRGAAAAAAASASGSANADDGGLEVYCDDQNGAPEAPAGAWRNLPAYQETRKENSRAATAWAGQRLKQKRSRPGQAGAPPPGPTLEVYQDEDLVLAEEQAAADAAAAAREARKNANALRRRLDAGGAIESGKEDSATDPVLLHGKGAPPPRSARAERLYSAFVPSDTTDERGAEVSYEETRARRWARARATSAAPAPAPAPGPIVPDPRAFATSTATTEPVLTAPPRAPSESPRSRPPLARRDAAPASGGSCDAPPSDAGSGVEGRGGEPRTDEARGSGLAPVDPGAAPPAAAAVPAGLRWTATEGGTYGAEPTMTLCTKEAWGDIMSMFSDGAPKAAQPPEPAHAADPPALREATERAARDIGTLEIREDTQFGFGGLEIREDTQFGGLEIQRGYRGASGGAGGAARPRGARAPRRARARARRARGFCGPELRRPRPWSPRTAAWTCTRTRLCWTPRRWRRWPASARTEARPLGERPAAVRTAPGERGRTLGERPLTSLRRTRTSATRRWRTRLLLATNLSCAISCRGRSRTPPRRRRRSSPSRWTCGPRRRRRRMTRNAKTRKRRCGTRVPRLSFAARTISRCTRT
jgi:checkpoint serine/threonine-protein kinase